MRNSSTIRFIMFQHFALTNRLQIGKIKVSGKKQDLILANNNLEKNMISQILQDINIFLGIIGNDI